MALPADRTIPPEKFPENVRRFVAPDSPQPLRQMLARGLVPMKPLVQVCALYQLAVSDPGELGRTATQSVRAMPPAALKQIAAERLLPVVLDWLAETFVDSREIVQTVVLNQTTDVDTLIRVAQSTQDGRLLEMLAANEAKLLQSPPLIEALYFNRQMRQSTIDRVLDLAARNQLKLPKIPTYQEVVAAIAGTAPKTEEEAAAADARFAAAQAALNELTGKADEAQIEEIIAAYTAEAEAEGADVEEEADEGPRRSKSAAGRIRDMNVAEKVRLAMLGTATERAILVRDTNKIVARAVIRSPGITDTEAIAYAKDKSMLDEVIHYIAQNKKWTRHYQIKLNLVMNPKTPTSEALRFMTHLRINDLRAVARSKGVPGPVSKAAKQMVKARMK
ncbi:MAG: hypothetical protein KC620_23490 [Myxococcales bacterium]|nr:hypothetical protein [Myxococcales bacterium]